MAMNKKEQAEFAAMKRAVLVGRALNWSAPIATDVPPPSGMGEDSTGFTFNVYSNEVLYARSSSIGHATSREEVPKRTSSQRAIAMYSTKLLALKALRHQVEQECALRLAKIDEQIESEKP